MTNHDYAAFRRRSSGIYRELCEPCLEFQSTHAVRRMNPSQQWLIELDHNEWNSGHFAFDMDDVIKHLRGACGVVDSVSSAVTERNRDSRKEDDHE